METRKVLSALSYFSIFFAGFLFPLVVYFASGDDETKVHAKKALFSHLIPIIPVPLLIFAIINDASALNNSVVPVFSIVTIVLMILISIIVVIWNVIKGVKVITKE
jgi:protein-S-isoprenylcysteine O-methyltransferase Ste14